MPDAHDTELACFDCGYDLRGQPGDGRCPECGTSVAETGNRFETLRTVGDPRPLGRGTVLALSAAGAFGGMLLLSVGLLLLPYSARVPPAVLILLAIANTLATATLIGLSAGTFASSATSRGVNRRALGLIAWAIPALVATLWIMVWTGLEGNQGPIWQRVITAVGISLWLAAGLFPPTSLIEVRRRAQLWPHWRWLPKAMYVTLWLLWVGFVCVSAGLLLGIVIDNLVEDFADRQKLRRVASFVSPIGTIAMFGGTLGYLACLIATLLGLRRLRFIFPQLDDRQRPRFHGFPLDEPSPQVVEERQPPPVAPQRSKVERR